MAIMEISIVPMGTQSPSVSHHIARITRVIEQESSVRFELTPMGTVIEGDAGMLLDLARRMHESAFNDEVKRIITSIKIDDRRDKQVSMEGKLNSLRTKMGERT